MKIAFAASSRLPSRAANSVQVMKMCEAFAAAGHQVELFARTSEKNVSVTQIFANYGVKPLFGVNFVAAPTIWGAGGAIFGCKVAARLLSGSFKPDIIYGRNIYSLLAGSLTGAKLYYESHATPANAARQLLERILFSLPGFTRLIVINRALQNYYLQTCQQLAASERISTLTAHDGATPLAAPAALSRSPNDSEVVIGYAGGLYPGKGLEIITRLAPAMPQFTFRIAGGSEGEIAAWKSSCPASNLHFVGFLNHTDISSFLSSCDILLAPYQTRVSTNPEGVGNIANWMSPLKIFEYMASGRPIIAAQLPAIAEILNDGVNARLVAPADVAAWCRVIRELAADRQQQKRLAGNAAADLAEKFSWSARARLVLAPEPLTAKAPAARNHAESRNRSSRRVKCLHIIGNLNSGGAEKMLCRLVKNSDKEVFEHQIITLFEAGTLASELEEAGIRVFNLGMARRFTSLLAFPRLTRMIRRLQPDLIQTWMYNAGIIGPLAAKAAGTMPIINSIRHGGFVNDPFKTVVSARLAAIVARAIKSRLITCSAAALKSHQQIGFPTSDALVIPNGFTLPERFADKDSAAALSEQLGLAENVPIVGWIGRYHPAKDHANFIRAATLVAAALPMTHFVMCGKDITTENTALKGTVDQAGLGNCVHLLGHRDDIAAVMRGLTLLVSSSITEAFANVVGEAMALAVPCVVTDVGDSAHIVADTGIIVPPSDSDKLAEGMQKMLVLSESQREALGQKARARVREHFALSGVVKQYEKLYLEVTDEQRQY